MNARSEPQLVALTPAFVNVAAAVHRLCFAEAWDGDSISSLLATPGTAGFIALLGPDPAGMVLYRVVAGEAEILTIGVLPAARGSGVGASLLDMALSSARSAGAAAVFLEVAEDNAAAKRLYARAGFESIARRVNYYRTGTATVSAEVYRLVLPSRTAAPPIRASE